MRSLLALLLLWPALLTAAPLADFQAVYDLERGSLRIAEVTMQLNNGSDNRYRFHQRTEAVGIARMLRNDRITEVSEGRYTDKGLRPDRYRYFHEGSDKDRNVAIDFDWPESRARVVARGQPWTLRDVPDGTLDKFVTQLALMRDAPTGVAEPLYSVADGGRLKQYRYERLGEETLETALGTLNTVKFRRSKVGKTGRTVLWCAPELGWLPVQVERRKKDTVFRMRLKSLSSNPS